MNSSKTFLEKEERSYYLKGINYCRINLQFQFFDRLQKKVFHAQIVMDSNKGAHIFHLCKT